MHAPRACARHLGLPSVSDAGSPRNGSQCVRSGGDVMVAAAASSELEHFGIPAGHKNYAAAYATGRGNDRGARRGGGGIGKGWERWGVGGFSNL